jgi:hypothetical protein
MTTTGRSVRMRIALHTPNRCVRTLRYAHAARAFVLTAFAARSGVRFSPGRSNSNASIRFDTLCHSEAKGECAFTGRLGRDAELRHLKSGLLRMLASSAAVKGAQAAHDAQIGDPPR